MTDSATRNADAREMLSKRRHETQTDILEDTQGDTEAALLQMRVETLTRIDEALVRIDAGEYGC